MKRTVIALTVTALAVGGAGVASAKPGNGNGAVKAGLEDMGSAPAFLGSCSAADESAGKQTANGFVLLNAPGKPAKDGKPGATRKLLGEVALKGAAPNSSYKVQLASGSGCGELKGTLTTNAQGNGNLSFQDPAKGAGTYYVVLVQEPLPAPLNAVVVQQSYASAPVTVR